MPPNSDKLSYSLDGKVAVLQLDDGKANVLSPDVIEDVTAALARAQEEARAVLIAGRPGRFSAGFDLSIMTAGADDSAIYAGLEQVLGTARQNLENNKQ